MFMSLPLSLAHGGGSATGNLRANDYRPQIRVRELLAMDPFVTEPGCRKILDVIRQAKRPKSRNTPVKRQQSAEEHSSDQPCAVSASTGPYRQAYS